MDIISAGSPLHTHAKNVREERQKTERTGKYHIMVDIGWMPHNAESGVVSTTIT